QRGLRGPRRGRVRGTGAERLARRVRADAVVEPAARRGGRRAGQPGRGGVGQPAAGAAAVPDRRADRRPVAAARAGAAAGGQPSAVPVRAAADRRDDRRPRRHTGSAEPGRPMGAPQTAAPSGGPGGRVHPRGGATRSGGFAYLRSSTPTKGVLEMHHIARRGVAVLGAVVLAGVTACSGGGGSTSTGGSVPGVTAGEVIVVTPQPLAGPAAAGYSKISAATKAYFDYVNANGGVFGRKITYKIMDDGYNPANTQQVVRQLVLQDKVFAILNGLGTPTHTGVLDFLNTNKVPDLFVA